MPTCARVDCRFPAHHPHLRNVVQAALEMQAFMKTPQAERDAQGKPAFEMRVGIHTGPWWPASWA
jgi:phosphopantetheinyl transferase